MRDWMHELRLQLRHEPEDQRVRAELAGRTVADTTRPVLVWEPRRVIPSYGVPVWDLRGDLSPSTASADDVPGILHPGIPFGVHTAPGQAFDLTVDDVVLPGAAFRPADPDLDGMVLLDFAAFDAWYVEDEPLMAHVRDPFHRVEPRRSSRRVRIELDGVVLAESTRPTLVHETQLPTRFYLPAEDVVGETIHSDLRTRCAYKGEATYLSFVVGGRVRKDLAWTYAEPLAGVGRIQGLVGFYDDVLDVFVDGRRRDRPRTLMSSALLDEVGMETA